MAARSRPSRVVAGSPARSRPMVAGVPRTLPSGATTATARCPALTSTATTGCRRSSSSDGAGAGAAFHDASMYQRPRCRVVADVVADRAGGRLGGDLVAPVGEPHRARQPVPAVRPVRQVRQRGGQLDLQPALAGVPADRLVPPGLVLLPVGGQEQPGRFPLPPATGPRSARRRRGSPRLRSRAFPPRTTDTAPAASRRSARASRACSDLQPDGLGVPLGRGGVPAHPARLPARRDRQPGLDPADPGLQAGLSARRFCSASRHWSSLVRVIAPAHRDDDSAVSARFRAARDTARPFASSRPSAHRAARSRPASDPRCAPAARSTASSARRPAAGSAPAPRPGQPPRTGRRSPAARSPVTTPHDTVPTWPGPYNQSATYRSFLLSKTRRTRQQF